MTLPAFLKRLTEPLGFRLWRWGLFSVHLGTINPEWSNLAAVCKQSVRIKSLDSQLRAVNADFANANDANVANKDVRCQIPVDR